MRFAWLGEIQMSSIAINTESHINDMDSVDRISNVGVLMRGAMNKHRISHAAVAATNIRVHHVS